MRYFNTILLLLFGTAAFSQSIQYTLFYFKGKVEMSADQKTWQPLTKINTAISNKNFIRINKESEAIFSSDKDVVVRLNTEGIFPVSDFAKYRIGRTAQSSGEAYINYLVGEITRKEEGVEKNYKEHLKNVGGVERGHYDECMLSPVASSFLADTVIRFSWKNKGKLKYAITICEDSALTSEKFGKRVMDTFCLVNPSAVKLETGKIYYWTISANGMPECNKWSFTILSDKEIAQINTDFNNLKKNLNYSAGLNKAIEAKFFEDKGMYETAREYYLKAIAVERDNPTLVELYKKFKATYISN